LSAISSRSKHATTAQKSEEPVRVIQAKTESENIDAKCIFNFYTSQEHRIPGQCTLSTTLIRTAILHPIYSSIRLSETYHFFPKGSRQQVNPWALVVEPHYHTILDVKSALCCESYSSAHYMLPFTFHQLLKDNKVSALQVFSLCKHAEQLNND